MLMADKLASLPACSGGWEPAFPPTVLTSRAGAPTRQQREMKTAKEKVDTELQLYV